MATLISISQGYYKKQMGESLAKWSSNNKYQLKKNQIQGCISILGI